MQSRVGNLSAMWNEVAAANASKAKSKASSLAAWGTPSQSCQCRNAILHGSGGILDDGGKAFAQYEWKTICLMGDGLSGHVSREAILSDPRWWKNKEKACWVWCWMVRRRDLNGWTWIGRRDAESSNADKHLLQTDRHSDPTDYWYRLPSSSIHPLSRRYTFAARVFAMDSFSQRRVHHEHRSRKGGDCNRRSEVITPSTIISLINTKLALVNISSNPRSMSTDSWQFSSTNGQDLLTSIPNRRCCNKI